MRRRLDDSVDCISQRAREEDTAPRQSVAETLACEHTEEAAQSEVSRQVEHTGMKTECGDDSPPLALADETRVGYAGCPPVERESLMLLEHVDQQEDRGEDNRADPAVRNLGKYGGLRNPITVLLLLARELLGRGIHVRGFDEHREVAFRLHDSARDTRHLEHDKALYAVVVHRRPKNCYAGS